MTDRALRDVDVDVAMDIYDALEQASPEERADLALRRIEEHPDHRLELPERDGRRANLCGVNLGADELRSRTRFRTSRSPWRSAALLGANLRNADLRGADLVKARLAQADLRGAALQGASLLGAELRGAVLEDASLVGADLSHANLAGARLQGANLAGARLQEADLTGAMFARADLSRADLSGAWLVDVDLTGCTLTHLSLAGARIERARLHWEQFGGQLGDELTAAGAAPALRAQSYARAANAYLLLGRCLSAQGDDRAASVVYRRERRMGKMAAWQRARLALAQRRWRAAVRGGLRAAADQAAELLCDYGESVWRVLGWGAALLLVIGPAAVALCGGLYAPAPIVRAHEQLASPLARALDAYGQYLLYMLGALTPMRFSELQPATNLARLASSLAALAEIALVGLLGFVAGQRIRRS